MKTRLPIDRAVNMACVAALVVLCVHSVLLLLCFKGNLCLEMLVAPKALGM